MALYSFFDEYDLSGKTVIPFSTHGGSSFAGTPAKIQSLEPNATMLDGLTISRNNIQDARQEIVDDVISRAEQGEQVFFPIYTEDEMDAAPSKRDTRLFFFRGEPGEKFAVVNAGGCHHAVHRIHHGL